MCFFQFMKPIYQGCMEKSIQHVATVATEQALGGSVGNRSGAMNGKVKKSWEYAIKCPRIKAQTPTTAQRSHTKPVMSNSSSNCNNNNNNKHLSSFSSSSWWSKLNFYKSKSDILPDLKTQQQKRKRDKG